MCRYKVVKQLGDGTYGSVWKAINNQTNDVVCAGLYACEEVMLHSCTSANLVKSRLILDVTAETSVPTLQPTILGFPFLPTQTS